MEFTTFNPNKERYNVQEDTALARDSARRFHTAKQEVATQVTDPNMNNETKKTYEESFISATEENNRLVNQDSFNVKAYT